MKIFRSSTAVVATLAVLALAGCAASPTNDASPVNNAVPDQPVQLRSDPEPIAGLLPKLGSDFTAQWFGDTVGDDSTPGAATYWVDALVTPAAGLANLIEDYSLSPSTPQVGEELTPLVPECEWEHSADLDRAWGPLDWETHVWFCQESEQLVVSMLGTN